MVWGIKCQEQLAELRPEHSPSSTHSCLKPWSPRGSWNGLFFLAGRRGAKGTAVLTFLLVMHAAETFNFKVFFVFILCINNKVKHVAVCRCLFFNIFLTHIYASFKEIILKKLCLLRHVFSSINWCWIHSGETVTDTHEVTLFWRDQGIF